MDYSIYHVMGTYQVLVGKKAFYDVPKDIIKIIRYLEKQPYNTIDFEDLKPIVNKNTKLVNRIERAIQYMENYIEVETVEPVISEFKEVMKILGSDE